MDSASASATSLEMRNAGGWERRCAEEGLAPVEKEETAEVAEAGEEVRKQVEGEVVEVGGVVETAGGLLTVQANNVGCKGGPQY